MRENTERDWGEEEREYLWVCMEEERRVGEEGGRKENQVLQSADKTQNKQNRRR